MQYRRSAEVLRKPHTRRRFRYRRGPTYGVGAWIELSKRLRFNLRTHSVGRRHELRLAVGSATSPQSSIWRIWTNGNDVYAAVRSMAHIEKLSFHQSGICRNAFTDAYGKPATLSDRATIKWKRAEVPPQGYGRASRVLLLAVPTNFLSVGRGSIRKPVTWIKPAPAGMATYIEFLFTREDALALQWLFAKRGLRTMIDFMPLPNGNNFVVCAHYDRWDERSVLVPASHQKKESLMFSAHDPKATGRPARLTTYNNPKDGDALIGQELGGYPISAKDLARFGRSYRTFKRSQVFAHEPKETKGVQQL
jgi:hypothetical protein